MPVVIAPSSDVIIAHTGSINRQIIDIAAVIATPNIIVTFISLFIIFNYIPQAAYGFYILRISRVLLNFVAQSLNVYG